MRFLHTADWHSGKALHRRNRLDELTAVLGEIVAIAEREAVDAVLVAGDVFDQKSPAAEAEAVVYQALLALEQHGIHVVLIAGNHDNPSRWGALRPLLSRFRVHVVADVTRPKDGGIVSVPARDGRTHLEVAALPWVPLRKIVTAATLMDPEGTPHATYAESLGKLMRDLSAPLNPDACTVLMGHMTVSGAIAGGGERLLTLGDVFAIDPQLFPQCQYVALGHIHKPQAIAKSAIPARYSGSPLQLDFGEAGYQTSVTLVDVEPGLPATIREIPLTAGCRLRDAIGTIDELEAHRASFGDAWLRVTLKCAKPDAALGDRVRDLLPNAIEVRLDYPREARAADETSVRQLSLRDQFARYLHDAHETAPDPLDLSLFEDLVDEVTGGRG